MKKGIAGGSSRYSAEDESSGIDRGWEAVQSFRPSEFMRGFHLVMDGAKTRRFAGWGVGVAKGGSVRWESGHGAWGLSVVVFFGAALCGASCSKKAELSETESGRPACEVFLVDPSAAKRGTPPESLERFSELSVAREFAAGFQLNSLTRGTVYAVRVTFRDPDGRAIEEQPEPVTVSGTGEGDLFFVPFGVDPAERKAGTWSAEVAIDGAGRTSGEFVLIAPNAQERVSLAQHEEAREQIFNAFASYWVGVSESPVTFMAGVSADEAGVRRPSVESNFGASFSSKDEKPPAQAGSRFFQIGGVGHDFVQDHVSEADTLNGISYRGRAAFKFSVYRHYEPESGWSRWQDIERAGSDLSAAAAGLGGFLFGASAIFETKRILFYEEPLAPALRYEVFCQDGTWFVVSDERELFVNGVKRGTQDPQILEIKEPKMLAGLGLFQPSLEVARFLVEEGASPRESARRLSESVKLSEEETKYQVSRTKNLLRGRRLE